MPRSYSIILFTHISPELVGSGNEPSYQCGWYETIQMVTSAYHLHHPIFSTHSFHPISLYPFSQLSSFLVIVLSREQGWNWRDEWYYVYQESHHYQVTLLISQMTKSCRIVFCRYLLYTIMGVVTTISFVKAYVSIERQPELADMEMQTLSLHDPIYYSVVSSSKPYPRCPRQVLCNEKEYNDYLQHVPLNYRVCSECVLEMQLRHFHGLPFMYHTIENDKYPTIPLGSELQYLCFPEINTQDRLFLLILILTSAKEIEERATLRSYYNRLHVNSTRFIFVTASNPEVNEAVARESEQYRDILQLNHVDSYHNLTLSVFGAFQFFSRDTKYAKYIMKTDSDCVLNLPRIERKLWEFDGFQYAGNCRTNVRYYTTGVRRKNYVPPELVGEETQIAQYATGAGYVIASSVLPKLVVALRHLPFIAHNEDVNVGRAMSLIHVKCKMLWGWIARNGCSEDECNVIAIIHSPNNWRKIWEAVLGS